MITILNILNYKIIKFLASGNNIIDSVIIIN